MIHQKTIVITGVHHTPAIELVRQLKNDQKIDWSIHYIAHQYPNETHLSNTISKLNIQLHQLSSGKFNRLNLLSNIFSPFKIISAFFRSYFLLKSIKPDIVVSFGGYISVPVIIAAKLLAIKSITHEQTLTISLSTKINSYFTNKIALSFPNSELPQKKIIITGNLIRQEIFNFNNSKYSDVLSINKPIIYITGGNQGSTFINNLIFNNLESLGEYTIIHQTGIQDYRQSTHLCSKFSNYYPGEYIFSEDIGWIFHYASLIISRAGANICQEINLLDKKAILIPLPKSQQNEQELNAQWLKSLHPKSVSILYQNQFSNHKFLNTINQQISLPYKSQIKYISGVHPLVKLINEMV